MKIMKQDDGKSNKRLGRFQLDLWEKRAEYKDLRSVFDPADVKGLKNRYMDLESKIIFDREMNFSSEDRVLDFGCGIGRLSYWVAPKVFSVTGIDVNKKSIAAAKEMQKVANIDFRAYDGINIPFEDETFDKVISNWVWQHILETEDFQATIKEVCRVLKRDGKICFIEQVAKWRTVPKTFAQDYIIWRSPEEYIREFNKNNCKLLEHYLIYARRKGFFSMLINMNLIPKSFELLTPLFVKIDLLYTIEKGIPNKANVDCLFLFSK